MNILGQPQESIPAFLVLFSDNRVLMVENIESLRKLKCVFRNMGGLT